MRTPADAMVLTIAVLATATRVAAQTRADWDVSVSVQGVASWRPVDDAYVGSPYLDKGLGGVGPGLVIGTDVMFGRGLLGFEYGFARTNAMQTGRLVSGTAEGQLRDHHLSVLAGGSAWSSPDASFVVLAGLSVLRDQPRQNGIPIDAGGNPAALEGRGWAGFTIGANYVKRLGQRRFDVVAGGRYSVLPRSRRAQELGVSPQLLRFGVGVRVRLT